MKPKNIKARQLVKDKNQDIATRVNESEEKSRNKSILYTQQEKEKANTETLNYKQHQQSKSQIRTQDAKQSVIQASQLSSKLYKEINEKHEVQKKEDSNNINDSQQNESIRQEKIKVAIRVRPPLQRDLAKEIVVYSSKNNKNIRVSDVTHMVESQYDKVFSKESKQSEIYDFVSGFNCTIFAYGQTGSGKTYTMFGEGFDDPTISGGAGKIIHMEDQLKRKGSQNNITSTSTNFSSQSQFSNPEKKGLIPRCINDLFKQIEKQGLNMTVYCSFLQIYNEKLFDLLQDVHIKNPLQIREEKLQGIYVEGLTEYVVQTENDCMQLLKRGERNRIKRSTRMNIKSSRSHSLFQLLIETDQVDKNGMLKKSKLNLGDLAGSEKINKEEEMQAKHLLELRNINLSLTTLGKVIQLLSKQNNDQEGQMITHIPFRESKLSRLLQDSLGGNTQTYLIATVAPTVDCIDETISTLKFADRAKCVMQRYKKNEFNAKDDALIMKLQKEVQYLKDLLQMRRKGNNQDISHQLYILRDENERLRQLAINFQDVEKMKQENKNLRLELQKLKVIASEFGSNSFDNSPKSLICVGNINSDDDARIIKKVPLKHDFTFDATQMKNAKDVESDTEDNIQEQFRNYKSDVELVGKVNQNQQAHKNVVSEGNDSYNYTARNSISNYQDNRSIGFKTPVKTNDIMKENEVLRFQKQQLQNEISHHQQIRSLQYSQGQIPILSHGKQFKQDDINDQLVLPQIKENGNKTKRTYSTVKTINPSQQTQQQKITQIQTNPYQGRSTHGSLQRSYDVGAMQNQIQKIQKPRDFTKRIPNVRNSLGNEGDVNASYQMNSMLTQSTISGEGDKTMIRIRGKNNQVINTTGSLIKTLEEEKRIEEKKRQMRRSNERFRMLEDMERQRQIKMQQEIDRLQQERQQREEDIRKKKEIQKQRRYMNANIGKIDDNYTQVQSKF